MAFENCDNLEKEIDKINEEILHLSEEIALRENKKKNLEKLISKEKVHMTI